MIYWRMVIYPARIIIFKSYQMLRKNDSSSDELQRASKEEIYQSAELEQEANFQIGNVPKQHGKKETKLQAFLAKINEEFNQELQDFLVKNKEQFESRVNPPKVVCLYEDVLMIWSFKKEEENLKKSKRAAIDILCRDLEKTIKKSQVTIKQRIQKKLSNLQISEIREFMKAKRDIAFNVKKELSKPRQQKPSSKSNYANDPMNQLASATKSTSNIHDYYESKKAVGEGMKVISEKKEEIVRKSLFQNESIYKYGTTKINENIKIMFNVKDKSIIAFKKSTIQQMFSSEEEKIISADTVEKISEDNGEKKQVEIVEKAVKIEGQNRIKVNRKQLNKIDGYFKKQVMSDAPKQYSRHIEKVKAETIQLIVTLENSQSSPENQSKIKELNQKLEQINKLEGKIGEMKSSKQMKEGQEKNVDDRFKKMVIENEDMDSDIDSGSEMKNKLQTTGKKLLIFEDQPVGKERNIMNEISQTEYKFQMQRFMHMICHNEKYISLLQQDPSKVKQYTWGEDEDKILWSYKFSPHNYTHQMICLLRYKTMSQIRERMDYIKLQVDATLNDNLNQLQTKDIK